jgi:hypothetical protein
MTKPKKLTSYQKLKNKIQQQEDEKTALRLDIYNILRGNFTDKMIATSKWKHIFDGEDIIWAGDSSYTITQ